MGKRGRVLIAGSAGTVLALLAWAFLYPSTPEPFYKGRPLSYWMQGYGNFSHDVTLPGIDEADAAVYQIGTNAIPWLLRATLDTNYIARDHAIHALGMMHSNPDAVVPVLIKALHDPFGPNPLAISALAQFHEDAKTAVPALVALLNQPDTNSNSVSPFALVVLSSHTQVEQALREIDPETYARVVASTASAPTQ